MDDATESNGYLQILPRRHKQCMMNHARDGLFQGCITETVDEAEAISIESPAGSAAFIRCMTPHASLPNTSDTPRQTLIVSYSAADVFPVHFGENTAKAELYVRLVRDEISDHVRFETMELSIPRFAKDATSLYDLQDHSRSTSERDK